MGTGLCTIARRAFASVRQLQLPDQDAHAAWPILSTLFPMQDLVQKEPQQDCSARCISRDLRLQVLMNRGAARGDSRRFREELQVGDSGQALQSCTDKHRLQREQRLQTRRGGLSQR